MSRPRAPKTVYRSVLHPGLFLRLFFGYTPLYMTKNGGNLTQKTKFFEKMFSGTAEFPVFQKSGLIFMNNSD